MHTTIYIMADTHFGLRRQDYVPFIPEPIERPWERQRVPSANARAMRARRILEGRK